nr:hypothetical protein Iba_chr09cCG7390 [Ipomoea batatas]
MQEGNARTGLSVYIPNVAKNRTKHSLDSRFSWYGPMRLKRRQTLIERVPNRGSSRYGPSLRRGDLDIIPCDRSGGGGGGEAWKLGTSIAPACEAYIAL